MKSDKGKPKQTPDAMLFPPTKNLKQRTTSRIKAPAHLIQYCKLRQHIYSRISSSPVLLQPVELQAGQTDGIELTETSIFGFSSKRGATMHQLR